MTLMLVAAAALIDADGRLLVQQRPAGKSLAGLWEFPGGKIEVGETPEAALARELAEELGIQAGPFTPATFASEPLGGRHLLLLLYICRAWEGIPAPMEGGALKWVRIEELRQLAIPPADLPMIPILEALL